MLVGAKNAILGASLVKKVKGEVITISDDEPEPSTSNQDSTEIWAPTEMPLSSSTPGSSLF